MKKIREITAEEENFRLEHIPGMPGSGQVKRDAVEPVPVGTVIAMSFRVVGYDKDCDGSLMARLECLDIDGETTGWSPKCIGLYENTGVVLDDPEELKRLSK